MKLKEVMTSMDYEKLYKAYYLQVWKITEKELESRKKAIADKFHLKNG